MNLQTVLAHTRHHLRQEGLGGTALWMLRRAQWRWNEFRYRIDTEEIIQPAELGFENKDYGEYQPTDYTDFSRLMRAVRSDPPIDLSQHVFVDFGAGKGRAIILAATYPFKRVTGIELSPKLAAAAKRNVEECRPALRCRDVEIITGDAALYKLPEDATIIYFNNSFTGKTLASVLDNMRFAAERKTKRILVVCNLPERGAFEEQIRAQTWLALINRIALNDFRQCLIFQNKPI